MPNYGFNENEIISTQTIMIDKDGFYKVVDGASSGEDINKVQNIYGFTKYLTETELQYEILIEEHFKNDHDPSSIYVKIDPYNTVNVSDYTIGESIDNIPVENVQYGYGARTSDESYVINGKLYDRTKLLEKPEYDYTGTIDFTDIPYAKVDESENTYHYEFDLSYIMVEDTTNTIIAVDVVHVVIPSVTSGSPK